MIKKNTKKNERFRCEVDLGAIESLELCPCPVWYSYPYMLYTEGVQYDSKYKYLIPLMPILKNPFQRVFQ